MRERERGEKMQKQRQEIVEQMAKEFPQIREEDKYYMAGYIMRAREEQERREKQKETA